MTQGGSRTGRTPLTADGQSRDRDEPQLGGWRHTQAERALQLSERWTASKEKN